MTFCKCMSTHKTVLILAYSLSLMSFSPASAQPPILSLQKAQGQNSCALKFAGAKNTAYEITEKGQIKISDELGKLFIDSAASQMNSTTGNRTELKRTVLVEKLHQALVKLSKAFPLQPRDAVKPGYKNVTVTHYLNVLKFNYKGKELDVKIRFRKYGTIKEGLPYTLENIEINPEMKDVSFIEYKIDHPDFENSVLKPRGPQDDADLNLIGTPDFLQNFDQIESRALARNSKNAESIETMLKMQNVLRRLHEARVPLKKESRTIYERTSYAIPIENPITKKHYEVQITIDEGILLYSYPYNKTVDAYKSEKPLTVVELKIPVELVDKKTKSFHEDMMEKIPHLRSIQTFLKDLTEAQAPGHEANKGKQSLIRALLEKEE